MLGSRLHGVEVVWCHRSGKGHRGNSATGTVVCFIYGGIVSHSMNAGLVTFVPLDSEKSGFMVHPSPSEKSVFMNREAVITTSL